MTETPEYYHISDIMSRYSKAAMYFIVGPRSDGKTYSFKEWAIRSWLHGGWQFAYVRRTSEEVSATRKLLWLDIEEREGVEIQMSDANTYVIRKVAKDGEPENEWETFGCIIPLTKAQIFKSAAFPKVNKICFDEFLLEEGNRRYAKGEVSSFQSLVFTIARDRDVKVICLSNAAAIANPYFDAYGVRSRDFADSEYAVRNNGNVVFHVYKAKAANAERLRNGLLGKIGTEEYLNYAIDNHFPDVSDTQVIPKPRAFTPVFTVRTSIRTSFTIGTTENGKYYVRRGFNNGVKAYALSRNLDVDEPYDQGLVTTLRKWNDRRGLFFQDADARAVFLGALY